MTLFQEKSLNMLFHIWNLDVGLLGGDDLTGALHVL